MKQCERQHSGSQLGLAAAEAAHPLTSLGADDVERLPQVETTPQPTNLLAQEQAD